LEVFISIQKNIESHQYFQVKRLIQVFFAVEITLLVVFIHRFFLSHFLQSALVFLTLLLLIPVYKLAKKNKVEQAATVFFYVLTASATQFIWFNGGLYDEALLAYPCILIAAATVGNKKLFLQLLVIISLSVLLNGLVNDQLWYVNPHQKIDLSSAFLILVIIYLTSYIAWKMFTDFKRIVERLNAENSSALESQQQIENLMHHDALTGLPNRIMAKKIFQKIKSNANSAKKNIYLMYIDLDNFKMINDALSLQAGDALLIELSQRMFQLTQSHDSVCRITSDEFIIIIESTKSEEYVASLAERIIEQVQKPFHYSNEEFICGCSIGITTTSTDGKTFDTLLKHADAAMHYSKSQGGNSFHFYNKAMNTHGHEYLSVVSDLRKAITQQQFVLMYQPKIDIKNNKVIGAEALIRWQHPQRGMIPPDDFIPQAEKSGLIVEIGDWVLDTACQQCKAWCKQELGDLTVAVNVSSKQFAKKDFYVKVENTLLNHKLSGSYLELEMTESMLIDNTDELRVILKNVHNLGVHLSIDDFGTGYSNLGYLKAFDIEYLKIDRSFIRDIQSNAKNKTLVRAIIQMAHGLEVKNIAEGVEDQETVNMLQQLECEIGQGYFWSKPLAADEFESFVTQFNQ